MISLSSTGSLWELRTDYLNGVCGAGPLHHLVLVVLPTCCVTEAANWCPVPGGGADALLFAGLAVFCSCALYSKLSAVWVLLAGEAGIAAAVAAMDATAHLSSLKVSYMYCKG
jgi:hypothetical protein